SKDTSNCDSETNTTQETVDQLPDTGDSNDSAPLAGAALISGLALLAARKSKKDKNA
ncbi:LPXTG cell wall anchor domain-containing protein, partial [Staphylococcus caprae]